jgi:N-acetylmuramoyl-L-alanine amidase
MRICLDAGHGGADSGAVYKGRRESDDVLKLVLSVGNILRLKGYEIIYTRRTDSYLSLANRCNISNNFNSDYFISIHRNAFNQDVHGVETFSHNNSSNKATELSRVVNNSLVKLGFRDRGIKKDDFQVLRDTNAPAILIEVGFIDSVTDNDIFDRGYNNIVHAIVNSITAYTKGVVNVDIPRVEHNKLIVDGILGVQTIKALQGYLGTPMDGVISNVSPMVRELQKRLNKNQL